MLQSEALLRRALRSEVVEQALLSHYGEGEPSRLAAVEQGGEHYIMRRNGDRQTNTPIRVKRGRKPRWMKIDLDDSLVERVKKDVGAARYINAYIAKWFDLPKEEWADWDDLDKVETVRWRVMFALCAKCGEEHHRNEHAEIVGLCKPCEAKGVTG